MCLVLAVAGNFVIVPQEILKIHFCCQEEKIFSGPGHGQGDGGGFTTVRKVQTAFMDDPLYEIIHSYFSINFSFPLPL